ncbi:SusC/RagA family TonB-linked outer membrane protein [Flavitalea flava]
MSHLPKQLLFVLIWSPLLLLLIYLPVCAAPPPQTVSFSGKDVPLKTVLASVKKQTGYGIFYENGEDMLKSAGNVTLDLKNVSLELFLKICLKNKPLDYAIEGTTIFIKKKEEAQPASSATDSPSGIGEIRGRVTNDKGEPLVNANIIVKRTRRGTATNANGDFILKNILSEDLIDVSFIGYKAQTVPVKSRTNLLLILEPATNELDKMVVQAYGQTSQRLATGNIGVVRAEDIAKQPVMNVLQAIQGQVAGVVVTNTSGYASGSIKIEIRGRNTINPNAPSDPLYIIDGVPLTILDLYDKDSYTNGSQGIIQSGIQSPANGQSPFFSINPADIESIEILKDADATAIYGSRGANGVILVTTKKGKPGKAQLEINVSEGISNVSQPYRLLNTQQYVAMRKEALANDQLPVDINNAPDLVVLDTFRHTDWQKYLFNGTGKMTDIQADLSGGDARTTFRIGAGYHYQTGIMTTSGADKRGSLSLNLNHKSLNQRFNLLFSGSYSLVSSDMIGVPGSVTLPPNGPAVYDTKGNPNFADWDAGIGGYPFSGLFQPYSATTNTLNSDLVLSYELIKGLQAKTNFGYNNIQNNQEFLTPIRSQDPAYHPTGRANFGNTQTHNLIIEPQLEFNSFINKGKLNILGGASMQQTSTSALMLTGSGYKNDALLYSVTNAPSQYSTNGLGEYKYAALFGRINYNWENKYILNLNARRDGSSKFGPGRQYGNFGSLGGSWIFSEEKWMKNALHFLSLGKLRGSYGTTGGDQIGNYSYLSRWPFGRGLYNGALPLTPQGHTDSLLHWQINRKLEAAIDLGFLKDRITIEAAWYRDRCNDQLVPFPTPLFSGFTSVTSNSPADVQNTGWEFMLNVRAIDRKEFNWSFKFLIGINRNKLLDYPNLSQSPYATNFVIGQSLNTQRLLHYTGTDQQTGVYAFQDKNKDGQITIDPSGKTSDDTYYHDLSTKFDGGFTNEFRYKNWELSLRFYFRNQIGLNANATLDAPGDNTNQPVAVLDRWQKPGDITNTPRFTTNPYYYGNYFTLFHQSDGLYTDASFIRLQNVSLSYSLSEKLLVRTGIKNLRIYIQGQNLLLITHYKGSDPELQSFGSLPIARIITAGVSCHF